MSRMNFKALHDELETLRRCIKRDEEAREEAWLDFDDTDEALLQASIDSMKTRVWVIEQILDIHTIVMHGQDS